MDSRSGGMSRTRLAAAVLLAAWLSSVCDDQAEPVLPVLVVEPDSAALAYIGERVVFEAAVTGYEGNAKVRWESADTAVFTVDSAGVVTARGNGRVRLVANLGRMEPGEAVSDSAGVARVGSCADVTEEHLAGIGVVAGIGSEPLQRRYPAAARRRLRGAVRSHGSLVGSQPLVGAAAGRIRGAGTSMAQFAVQPLVGAAAGRIRGDAVASNAGVGGQPAQGAAAGRVGGAVESENAGAAPERAVGVAVRRVHGSVQSVQSGPGCEPAGGTAAGCLRRAGETEVAASCPQRTGPAARGRLRGPGGSGMDFAFWEQAHGAAAGPLRGPWPPEGSVPQPEPVGHAARRCVPENEPGVLAGGQQPDQRTAAGHVCGVVAARDVVALQERAGRVAGGDLCGTGEPAGAAAGVERAGRVAGGSLCGPDGPGEFAAGVERFGRVAGGSPRACRTWRGCGWRRTTWRGFRGRPLPACPG